MEKDRLLFKIKAVNIAIDRLIKEKEVLLDLLAKEESNTVVSSKLN